MSALESGESQPGATLVLLPGMHGTGHLFGPLITALGIRQVTRIVTVSYPFSAGDYVAVEAVIDKAQLIPEGEIVLLAESFAGPLALRLALRLHTARRLRGLVFAGSFIRSPLAYLSPRLIPLWTIRPPRWLLKKILLNGCTEPMSLSLLEQVLHLVPPATLLNRLRAVLGCDERATLPALAGVPTIYLHAQQDRLVGAHVIADFAALHPLIVTLAAPHLILLTRPGECAQAIVEMLGSHLTDSIQSR